MLPTATLQRLITGLVEIPHVRMIRLGTRALSYLPNRITDDMKLVELFHQVSIAGKRLYLVSHFNHAQELSAESDAATDLLVCSGVVLANQSVLLCGVNDNSLTLRQLFTELATRGIVPYYLFQCKFATATGHFRVPLVRTYRIFSDAVRGLNGLAKRARLVMAHASGKIEILGVSEKPGGRVMYLRYHQARDESLVGQVFCRKLPDDAYWLDDLPIAQEVT